ncbi:ABC transporter ATP-binding protein [Acidaminobacter sp. JC074]|uniref:ABC transporter ATP-binding protein n=1 Tax=Acidaminobacter sp. JC074 TaxID=2530199 RepID=UPI001F0EB357|nr:ABC transporter ATP-binding protein [Acidaminobacter sp. JC074]MCH4887983.1 ABC transporter ATP-binding protein [Acidaminobacter sp. JC074]
MIQVKNLYHSYSEDDNYAVDNISFEIKKGEIFGFLGPSGAGKSTTQKILIGLLSHQKGQILLDGQAVDFKSRERLNEIGVSFEIANVYKKLTGLENLEFHAKMYKGQTADPLSLLDMVGLKDAANKKAGEYSKGMLQRLVFARSMINNPKIWFLDEPTSGLDPTTASKIKSIIKQKQKEGTTIFLTTHNMFTADELCDRVAFLNDGKIVALDTPRNLKLEHGQKLASVEYEKEGKIVKETLSMSQADSVEKLYEIMKKGHVDTIHSQEATLEQIFIKLTGRGLEE